MKRLLVAFLLCCATQANAAGRIAAHDVSLSLAQNCVVRYQIHSVITTRHIQFTPPWDCGFSSSTKGTQTYELINATAFFLVNNHEDKKDCFKEYRPLIIFKNKQVVLGKSNIEHKPCTRPLSEEEMKSAVEGALAK